MNTVKPYTDEELREAREHMARCADREFISVVEFRRLLATLDERDRQLAEAMPPRALREWREALGEYAPEDTGGWSPLVGATHAVVRDLDERTRERDEARSGLDRAAHALNLRTDATTAEVAQWVEEQARLLRLSSEEDHSEAISLRDELDAVASNLGVSTDLDGAEKTLRCVAEIGALRGRLSVVERERDAEAHAASNHAECAERALRSACDLRDALDSVAGALGVSTGTDADTEARACVEAAADLREEVERLRGVIAEVEDHLCDAEDRQHDTFAARIESAILRQYEARVAAESRAEEAEERLKVVRLRLNAALQPAHMINGQPGARTDRATPEHRRTSGKEEGIMTTTNEVKPYTDDAADRRASTEERRG